MFLIKESPNLDLGELEPIRIDCRKYNFPEYITEWEESLEDDSGMNEINIRKVKNLHNIQ